MMLNNNPYSEVKGFNYWPSYAMVLNDVMDRFDLEIVKRELKGAQNLGASCVRVWVSNVSWQRSAPRFLLISEPCFPRRKAMVFWSCLCFLTAGWIRIIP
ncbi:MAG: hypothetical protein ACLR30_12325 [[Clostridium] leptum]